MTRLSANAISTLLLDRRGVSTGMEQHFAGKSRALAQHSRASPQRNVAPGSRNPLRRGGFACRPAGAKSHPAPGRPSQGPWPARALWRLRFCDAGLELLGGVRRRLTGGDTSSASQQILREWVVGSRHDRKLLDRSGEPDVEGLAVGDRALGVVPTACGEPTDHDSGELETLGGVDR